MQYPMNSYQPAYFTAGIPQQVQPQLAQMFQFSTDPTPRLSYRCNFLEQLQGLYEMESGGGLDRIHVLMPTFENWDLRNQGCTIVRRVCADGEALSDQMILEDPDRFILCTLEQEVIAHLVKGKDMKNGITWTSAQNAHDFFWKRSGQVTFKYVSATKFNRSMSQGQQEIANMSMSTSMNSSPENSPYDEYNQKLILEEYSTCSIASCFNYEEGGTSPHKIKQEQTLFDLIKTYCEGRPNLLKKVVYWGLSKDQEPETPTWVSPEMVEQLGTGRIWLCCMLNDTLAKLGTPGRNNREHDALSNLKGAYQEMVEGSDIYFQPMPGANQPGKQHRLRKEQGFWIIEERGSDSKWNLRAKEQSGRWWLDMNNVRKPIRVKIIPLAKILERMADYIFDGEIEKQLNFLYLDCNQKKLNTKLKKRNLKHSIQSLKAKLEKQNCLKFAVRVVNVADTIAKEYGVYA